MISSMDSGTSSHILFTAALNSPQVVHHVALILASTQPQPLSMGFRSGELGGQLGRSLTDDPCSLFQALMSVLASSWDGSLSCW